MQKFSRVVLTVAMLLGMLAMVPHAQATVYDPTNINPPLREGLVRLNQGGLGDALYGDFYRATLDNTFGTPDLDAGNFVTYVSIENTSGNWVAAHVRLRSARYSIEILDFPILLSPYDVFWFQFKADSTDGGKSVTSVTVFSDDEKTCKYSDLTETNGQHVWNKTISNALLLNYKMLPDWQKVPAEMAIGEIEVFGLWSIPAADPGGVKFADVLGTMNVNSLQNQFYTYGYFQPNWVGAYPVIPSDCPNVLSGRVFSGDFNNGLYTGYSMQALANFRTSCTAPYHRDLSIRSTPVVAAGPIVYKPIKFGTDLAYTDPDWATNFGPTWNDGDDWTQGGVTPVDSWSLDEVDDALAKASISSTYFNSGFTGQTYTLAVISFPTKFLHVFYDNYSGIPEWTAQGETHWYVWPVGQPDLAGQLRESLDVANLAGVVSLKGRLFNQEELPYQDKYSPQPVSSLKSQVNVLPIGAKSLEVLADFANLDVGGNDILANIIFSGAAPPNFKAGWFELGGFGMSQNGVDPRNYDAYVDGYDSYIRTSLPLLNCLLNTDFAYGSNRMIPASVLIMDWEFLNGIPHSRAFVPTFNNPSNCGTEPAFPTFCVPENGTVTQ